MARLTDQQLADRRNHLGASDIATLAGVNPYQSPFELYLEKIGELDPDAQRSDADRARMERGHRLEDVALDWHAEIEGISIERIRRDIIHPDLPFIVVHPDARVKPWRQTKRLLEAKTSAKPPEELPQRWEAQVQAQMAATGADVADIVVLGFDGPPTKIEVPRNPELIEALEGLASAFWDRKERRDPPPLDGSRGTSRWLDRLFREGPEERADASQADALEALLAGREAIKGLEEADGLLVNALKFSMAGGSRLYAPGVGRILWTAPTTRKNVKWKEVAAAYRAQLNATAENLNAGDDLKRALAAFDAVEAEFTTIEENVRTFRPTAAKPEAPE